MASKVRSGEEYERSEGGEGALLYVWKKETVVDGGMQGSRAGYVVKVKSVAMR